MGDVLPKQLLDGLAAEAINRCRVISEQALALAQAEFASDSPRSFATLISDIALAAAEKFGDLRESYDDDPANVLTQVQFLDDFVKDLGADLRYVDGAQTRKLPWSLPEPVAALLDRFLPGKTLLLRPQWKYNYSIILDDLPQAYRAELSQMLSPARLEQIFGRFKPGFHIVSFPSIERKTALFHSDLAHEIGHLAADLFLQTEDASYLIHFSDVVRSEIEGSPDGQQMPALWLEQQIADTVDEASRIRERAIEELMSDRFAARVFGPAALFGLLSIAASDALDLQPSLKTSYYPPWRLRLRLILKTLEAQGLTPEAYEDVLGELYQPIKGAFDSVRDLVGPTPDIDAINADWRVKLAYDSVFDADDEISRHLESEYGKQFFPPARTYAGAASLVERLRVGIPPNEVQGDAGPEPASLEAIFNAAWFYRVAFLAEPFSGSDIRPDFLDEFDRLNRLTLKGAEFAHLQTDYQSWTSEET